MRKLILSDIELTKLKSHLEKLNVVYQGTEGSGRFSDDITFVRSIIDKISTELTNVNKVIYNKIGNNGYINKIYAGGKLVYYHDKYHNLICDQSLVSHIGDIFEYNIVDITKNTTDQSMKILITATYTTDDALVDITFA